MGSTNAEQLTLLVVIGVVLGRDRSCIAKLREEVAVSLRRGKGKQHGLSVMETFPESSQRESPVSQHSAK